MTMRRLSTYNTFDIIIVPFPFTGDHRSKIRPALVLSSRIFFNDFIEHTVAAMITSASHTSWPHDIEIQDRESCGLENPSLIRFKLFTIDNRLIKDTIGKLSTTDQHQVRKSISNVFNDLLD
jgi:mRNA interferase MazF